MRLARGVELIWLVGFPVFKCVKLYSQVLQSKAASSLPAMPYKILLLKKSNIWKALSICNPMQLKLLFAARFDLEMS